MSIHGIPGGYNRNVSSFKRQRFDVAHEEMVKEPKPIQRRKVRIDLPIDIYEALEQLALDSDCSVNGAVIKLLREGLASSGRR